MMTLEIFLPFGVFMAESNIRQIVVETAEGSFGLLPQRLDCVAALVPGILIYQTRSTEVYVAIDAGVLVKTGSDVAVSVRHAVAGSALDQLHDTVEQDFLKQSIQEQQLHSVFKKMESDFMSRLSALKQHTL